MEASHGRFITATDAAHVWELDHVKEIRFAPDGAVSARSLDTLRIRSSLAPETVSALVTKPDRMSSLDLYRYVDYLKQNKQQAERYEIALWKRVVYPFVIWVMMLMALPAAFLQARAGAVGARVFVGILIGVGFHLVNSLFSHLGILNTWPAPIMALLPSAIALLPPSAKTWIRLQSKVILLPIRLPPPNRRLWTLLTGISRLPLPL